jgi:hypothetical protein
VSLALGSAARPRAGREDGRVRPVQEPFEVPGRRRLQVADRGLRARRPQVARLLGLADDARDLVPAPGEQPLQPQRDLAMSARDDNSHTPDPTPGLS